MKLAYTIIYSNDVPASIAFYEKAFGQKQKFMHDSGMYAELDTGGTTLAFAHFDMAHLNGIPVRPNLMQDQSAAGIEIAFSTSDPKKAYDKAIAAGCKAVKPPEKKPWGQTVAYVRDIHGCLVEICTPMN
jgi:lactoylglutathione lyase